MAKQRTKENAVRRAARKLGGTLIFSGKDVRTGERIDLEVDLKDYQSTVVDYTQIARS